MQIRFCISTTFITLNGVDVQLIEGRAYPADDPAVKAYPKLFTDTPRVFTSYGVEVEQATAAPGEKRGLRAR